MQFEEVVSEYYTRIYDEDDNSHKPNGPAIMWDNGDWDWYLYNQWHRYYGPQTNPEFCLSEEWWLHGEKVK